MARKISSDPAEVTKLDFKITKADVIDYYCINEQDQLEEQISQVALQLIKTSKELHELVIKHDDLPQMRRQIKKATIGRVLQGTKEGRLLLKTLQNLQKVNRLTVKPEKD